MRKDALLWFSAVIGIFALACNAPGALSVEEQVKMLAERYRQVEDQLARSIRYTSKDESLQISKVSNDGTIDLEASEQCRFGDCRGETIFRVNERLRLSDSPKGPRLEILKMRRLPNDQ